MAVKRIYLVHINTKHDREDRLVRAENQASALRHVARGLLDCRVAKQEHLVELVMAGVQVENAGVYEVAA